MPLDITLDLPPLHAATARGDVDSLARLLDNGADPEERVDINEMGYTNRDLTALLVAAGAARGSAAAVHLLLARGADPLARSSADLGVAWYAAVGGDPARLALVLNAGADPDDGLAGGRPAIGEAAGSAAAPCVRLLLDRGASPHPTGGLAGYARAWGFPIPLFRAAAAAGGQACVAALLAAGCPGDARNRHGQTAAMAAAGGGDLACLVAMLVAGCPADAVDEAGRNALMAAAAGDALACLEHLLAGGLPADARTHRGQTALFFAAGERSVACLAALLAAGCPADARDEQGATALFEVARLTTAGGMFLGDLGAGRHDRSATVRAAQAAERVPPVVAALLAAGCPADARAANGYGALDVALREGQVAAAEALVAAGVDPRASGPDGVTALLRHCTFVEDAGTVARLLAWGADPTGRLSDGRTALHLLAAAHAQNLDESHVAAIRLLAAAGAPVDARDQDGQTPLHVAAVGGNLLAAGALLALGADLEAEDADGLTPLLVAADGGRNAPLLAALLAHGADTSHADQRGWTAVEHARWAVVDREMGLEAPGAADDQFMWHLQRHALRRAVAALRLLAPATPTPTILAPPAWGPPSRRWLGFSTAAPEPPPAEWDGYAELAHIAEVVALLPDPPDAPVAGPSPRHALRALDWRIVGPDTPEALDPAGLGGPATVAAPDWASWIFLGHDVVEVEADGAIGNSFPYMGFPLWAAESLNRHGLVEDLAEAIDLAQEVARKEGVAMALIEVWREPPVHDAP